MNSIDFCFWLQGAFEINDAREFDKIQTAIIKNHLQLVFKHEIDDLRAEGGTKEELQAVHDGSETSLDSKKPFPNLSDYTHNHSPNHNNDMLVRC